MLEDLLGKLFVDEAFFEVRVVPVLDLVGRSAGHALCHKAPLGAVLDEELYQN